MKKSFLLSGLVFFLIVVTLIAYNASSVYGADKKDVLEINKILQSGFEEANKGDLDAAIGCFNKAISLDENNSYAYYRLGLLYLSLNKKEAALEKYKILENLNKDLADQLYEQIQLRFSISGLIRRILFMRSTDNLYLRERDRRSITLYIDKDLSKNDILTRENPVKPQ